MFLRKGECIAAVLFFGVIATGSSALAAAITVPFGLDAGDQFRLAFVTSAARDATSSDIADYNAFVTSVANSQTELAALNTSWRAIGTTVAVDARDNTETDPANPGHVSVPIYLLDGITKIADDNADLWDGSLDNNIDIREDGTSLTDPLLVYTGIGDVSRELGTAEVRTGLTGTTLLFSNEWFLFSASAAALEKPFYAMSDVLTVSAVPVPGTLALFLTAVVLLRRFVQPVTRSIG